MRSKLKGELRAATAALSITLLVAALAAASPLEDFLSVYPFLKVYPWYVYWRVAVAMFLLWIVAISLVSKENRFIFWLAVISALALATSHYAALSAEKAVGGVEVELLPLFYKVKAKGGETLKLDIAQLVLLATLVEHALISRKPPRAASSERHQKSSR